MATGSEAADSGRPLKKLRTLEHGGHESPKSRPRWTNASEGVDCFQTHAAPSRNRAREILEQVKNRKTDAQKPKAAAWTDSNFISFDKELISSMDFAPPTLGRDVPTSISRKAPTSRFARVKEWGKRAGFSHRDNLHANQRNGVPRKAPQSSHVDDLVHPHPSTCLSLFSRPSSAFNDSSVHATAHQNDRPGKDSAPHFLSRFKLPPKPPKAESRRAVTSALDYSSESQSDPALVQRSKTGKKRKHDAIEFALDLVSYKCADWQGTGLPFAASFEDRNITDPRHMLNVEIMNLYDYVKPRSFEADLRSNVIKRLQNAISRERPSWRAQVHCFGSFASGLYLPDSDIDLVLISEDFDKRGVPHLATKKHLFALTDLLKNAGKAPIALHGSAMPIHRAKVPIVKYTDAETGLRVDVSFENKSGLPAVDTCKSWAQKLPALPILVSLLKLYLLQREVNEVRDGGLGGFSVICLVYHYLKTMELQPGWRDPMEDIGKTFIELLRGFGENFDLLQHGLNFHPISLLDREREPGPKNSTRGNLMIVDPHNRSHDISAGSYRSAEILKSFGDARKLLTRRMDELRGPPGVPRKTVNETVLGVLYAGNYAPFDSTRDRLYKLSQAVS